LEPFDGKVGERGLAGLNLKTLTMNLSWGCYSKQLAIRIVNLHNVGFFSEDDAQQHQMRLVEGGAGTINEGRCVRFYWLIDPDDGLIVDAKCQVFGPPTLIGAADVACDLLVQRSCASARNIDPETIDKRLRDKPAVRAFPLEARSHLDLVIFAIKDAVERCKDIPLAGSAVRSDHGNMEYEGCLNYEKLSHEEKLAFIEKVLDEEVRPFIAFDGGGISIKDLVGDYKLIIVYEGTCASCFAATGATLSYIKNALCSKVHPDIDVVPYFSDSE